MVNIIAAIITIIYVIGGGSSTPHYIIIASIEVGLLFVIIWSAWKWTNKDEKLNQNTYVMIIWPSYFSEEL